MSEERNIMQIPSMCFFLKPKEKFLGEFTKDIIISHGNIYFHEKFRKDDLIPFCSIEVFNDFLEIAKSYLRGELVAREYEFISYGENVFMVLQLNTVGLFLRGDKNKSYFHSFVITPEFIKKFQEEFPFIPPSDDTKLVPIEVFTVQHALNISDKYSSFMWTSFMQITKQGLAVYQPDYEVLWITKEELQKFIGFAETKIPKNIIGEDLGMESGDDGYRLFYQKHPNLEAITMYLFDEFTIQKIKCELEKIEGEFVFNPEYMTEYKDLPSRDGLDDEYYDDGDSYDFSQEEEWRNRCDENHELIARSDSMGATQWEMVAAKDGYWKMTEEIFYDPESKLYHTKGKHDVLSEFIVYLEGESHEQYDNRCTAMIQDKPEPWKL